MSDHPSSATAELHVLFAGHILDAGDHQRVAPTVTFVRDGDHAVVIDPGTVPHRDVILRPLADLGVDPAAVTDVVFSHHHPDHTVNAALFPSARIHDHWAIYEGDHWLQPEAPDRDLSPSVRLIATPGHTPQDVTTLVGTPDGVVALTHLWFYQAGPPEDPVATDPDLLHAGRERVLALADRIIPGHGPAFTPNADTPR